MKNLIEILKNCPKGREMYTTTRGDVELSEVGVVTIEVKSKATQLSEYLNMDGTLYDGGECLLFPSYCNRDWSNWRILVMPGDYVIIDGNVVVFEGSEHERIAVERWASPEEITEYNNRKKWNPMSLNNRDLVLVCWASSGWTIESVSHVVDGDIGKFVILCGMYGVGKYDNLVPYNNDTFHLLGTHEDAPTKYVWWK